MSSMDQSMSYGPGLLRSMWRYRVAIAIAGIVFGLLGFFVSSLLPESYEATATVSLAETDPFTGEAVAEPERLVQQEANRMASRAVYTATADALGDTDLDTVRRRTTVSADPAIGTIEVEGRSGTADGAAELANQMVQAYQQIRREASVAQVESASEVLQSQADAIRTEIADLRGAGDEGNQTRIGSLQTQLATLESRITQMEADAALYGAGTDSVESAVAPPDPASPQPVRNAAAATVVGLAIAAALAYWRAGVVDTAAFDPGAMISAPLLAEIPEFKATPHDSGANPLFDLEAAEAYQFLVTSFEYALQQSDARSVVITSVSPGDGKSLTSLHLARALALRGRDVVLVDSDIRARGLTSLLRAESQPGLVALAEGADLDSVIRRYRISESVKLPVVPAGQPTKQPTGLLATDQYRDALSQIIERNDLTVIDAGPLLTVADASAVASQVSGILMVIDSKVPEEDLRRVQNRLRVVPTPVLGYVLNRVPDVGKMVYPYGPAEQESPGLLARIFGRQSRRARPVRATARARSTESDVPSTA